MTEVLLDVRDGVAVLTLNAPQRRNALTAGMARELSATLSRVEADPDVRALVLHGEGAGFCAGATLALLADAGSDPLSETARAEVNDVYAAFTHLRELSLPSVAAIHGAAVGAGLNLALAATLRIVGHSARLFSGFHRIGLHPGGGHLLMLAQAAGEQTAAALALFGQEVGGHDAVSRGLAWEAVPDERLIARAIELAASVSADRELVRATMRSLRMSVGPPGLPLPAALELERGAQQWSMRRRGTPPG